MKLFFLFLDIIELSFNYEVLSMLDIKKFKQLPIEQQQELKEALKFVDDMFSGDTEMKNEYLMQYGVFLQKSVTNVNAGTKTTDSNTEDNSKLSTKEQENSNKDVMVYNESWIVMQNRLLHAISHLTLDERRFILFLSPLVRQEIIKNPYETVFTVNAKDFLVFYDSKNKNYYSKLLEIAEGLKAKNYVFWDFRLNDKVKSRVITSWVSQLIDSEHKSIISVELHKDTIEMLTVFDKTNPFTKYQKEWIVKLGAYGIILLELIVSCLYQKYKKKSYTIEYLREKFDCVDNYPDLFNFKRYVIDRGIKDIHKHTPIKVTYEQKKQGRQVTEIVFSFKDTSQQVLTNKKEAHQLTQDTYKNFKMTKKQLNFFGGKIATELGKDIEAVIQDLTNVYLQNQYIDMLKQLNYVPTKYFTDKEIAKQPTLQAIEQQQAEQKRIIKEREVKEQVNKEALQAKFAEDLVKLKQHAKEFALANRHLINSYGIDRHYFDNKEYDSLIAYCWKEQLTDPKQRKYFRLLDEILAR